MIMSSDHIRIMDNIEDRLYRYRARRLRFLINGDKFFTGINYALNTEKIRSFDALLNDLTRSLMDHVKLCKGVRYIFTLEGIPVTTLSDFQDGNTYICSSIDTYILTEYRINNGMLNWLVRNSACISSSSNVRNKQRKSMNTSTIEGNYNNASSATLNSSNLLLIPNTTKTTTTRATTITSHNISGVINSSNNNNHISQHNNSQQPQTARSPISNHHSKPTSASAAKVRTPKRQIDTNLSHHNNHYHQDQTKSSTPKIKPKVVVDTTDENNGDKKINNNVNNNNSNSRNNRIGSQSPQKQQQNFDKWPQKGTTFGLEVIGKYDIGRPIGDGHFSVVYCCMNKSSQEFCALKLIDKLKCRGRDDMIYNEVKILKKLNHPNIVKLIEEFNYSKELYLILELVQDGDLFDAISTVTKFDEVHVSTMIHNLSSALSYLHRQGIVHRDIKPENLLISVQEDGSQSLKLADFGLAVEVGDNPLYSVCGTAFYVSPEMLNETGYDYKVDVWSTGVICFILLCGYPPFTSENESNQDELFDAILAGNVYFAQPYWSKISQHAKNLIKNMLTVDPEQRYTAEQVFKHPWTNGMSSNFDGINPMNMSRKIALQLQ